MGLMSTILNNIDIPLEKGHGTSPYMYIGLICVIYDGPRLKHIAKLSLQKLCSHLTKSKVNMGN